MLLSGSRSYSISVRRTVPRVASIQNRPLAGTSSPRGSWMIVGRAFSSKATSTAGNPAIVLVPFRLKASRAWFSDRRKRRPRVGAFTLR